jgi:hypothetical protein
MSNNEERNFEVYIDKTTPSTMVNNIDTTNTVDGKPIYYICNKSGINNFSGAGLIYCITCTGTNIQEVQTIGNNKVGIFLIGCTGTTINSVKVNSCDTGIYGYSSTGITISNTNSTNSEGTTIILISAPELVQQNPLALMQKTEEYM